MNSEQKIENINNSKNFEIQQYKDIISQTENNIPPISKKLSNGINTKKEGRIIYLATDNEEYKLNLQTDNINNNELTNKKSLQNIKIELDKIIHNYNNLMSQRSIELNIDKNKIKKIPNGFLMTKPKKSKKIKVYKNKKNNLNTLNQGNKYDFSKYKNINNINSELNDLNQNNKQIKNGTKISQSTDNVVTKFNNNKNTYIRKINIQRNPTKENDSINKNQKTNILESNANNILSDLEISRNEIIKPKLQTYYTSNEPELKTKNINEKKASNNEPILDILVKFENNSSHLNRSLEVKENNSFYNSINVFNDSVNEKLNNCKIMDDAFLSGIKNEDRKNSLKNAIAIYNRFKKKNNKFTNFNIHNSPRSPNPEINTNMNEIKEENEKENKNILNNLNTEEDNESEFSFNSKPKKKEEKNSTNNNNQINNMLIDYPTSMNLNNFTYNYNEGNEDNESKKNTEKNDEIDNKLDNFIDKINYKIKDDDNKEDEVENKIEDKIKEDENVELKTKIKKLKKPSFYVRKLIREEHYYVDEDGKEKILEVNECCVDEEDKKKIEKPYIKKNMNLKEGFNSSKVKEDKNNFVEKNNHLNNGKKNYVEINSSIKNEDNRNYYNNIETKKNKNLNSNNNKIKKINLIYDNKIGLNLEKKIKNALKIFETGSPRSPRLKLNNIKEKRDIHNNNNSNNNTDIIKEFNCYFFNNGKNTINESTDNKRKNSNYINYNSINNNIIRQRSPVNLGQNDNFINFKKDIFNIKKDRPIIIHSSTYLNKNDNVNRLTKPKLSLINTNVLNINDIRDEHSLNYEESSYVNTPGYKENNDSLNIMDSYIKVNKVEKFKSEKILNTSNKKRAKDFNKRHHVFHEIKVTKNKLASNSQSNYYSNELSLEDLNTSLNTNNGRKFSIKSINYINNNGEKYIIKNPNVKNIFEINSIIKKKQKNFSQKSNSDSHFSVKNRVLRRNSNNGEKSHHKYYESKSTKKKLDSDYESEGNTGRNSAYLPNFDRNNININKAYKINHKEKYFYQNFDGINNINRVLTQYN